jgi:hypothetical protein
MIDRPTRLGDTIDDYCSRCKLVLDHARHGKAGRKKSSKKSLFDQILEKRPPTRVATMPTTKKPSAGEEDD